MSHGGEAIRRAARALDCFSRERPRRTLSELARETLRGILTTLVKRGMLGVDAGDTYELGFTWLRFAVLRRRQVQVRDIAVPAMRALVDELRETVILSTRVSDQRVHIEYVESPQPVRRLAQVGNGGPLHVGAAGMALLASLPRAEQKDYVARALAGPDAVRVEEELAQAQVDGFSIAVGSVNPDTAAVAKGIRTISGEHFAMTISCPTERFTKELEASCIASLQAAVTRLETLLGEGA